MTLRAKEILEECDVVSFPISKVGERSSAFEIVSKAMDMTGKRVEPLLFEMNPDEKVRERCRAQSMDKLCSLLDEGNDVAMVTLGDVGIYSTYMYIDNGVSERGYETEVIPGVPSFCHGAALARVPLMIGNEGLAVVPVAQENTKLLRNAMDHFDNIVVMKAARFLPNIVLLMMEYGFSPKSASVFSNVGMDDEYIGPLDLKRDYGYFTTVLLKKNGGMTE